MTARILVIEDNPVNMELATDLLEIAGFTVLQADNAEKGIELAKSEMPGLILMDIGLPVMDGLAATALLKSDAATRHIPVVALTAQAMKGDQEKAMDAGCDGYITKPIDTREFPRRVAQYIR